jgi:hypothetical protein
MAVEGLPQKGVCSNRYPARTAPNHASHLLFSMYPSRPSLIWGQPSLGKETRDVILTFFNHSYRLCAFYLVCTKLSEEFFGKKKAVTINISLLQFSGLLQTSLHEVYLAIFSKVQTPKFKFEGLKSRFCSSYRFDHTPKWFFRDYNKIVWLINGRKRRELDYKIVIRL